MKHSSSQRGDVPVGCLIGLVLLAVIVLVAIKVAPVMIKVQEFEKEVKAVADRGNRIDYTDKIMYKKILFKAEELGVPVTKDDISIVRTQARITVHVEFVEPVPLPGKVYLWHKVIHEERPLF